MGRHHYQSAGPLHHVLLLLRYRWRQEALGLSFSSQSLNPGLMLCMLTSIFLPYLLLVCIIPVFLYFGFDLLSSQWKKYLTTMQITQFVIDLGIIYFASACLFLSRSCLAFRSLLVYYSVADRCLHINFYFTGYGHFAHVHGQGLLPQVGNCAGSEGAALFGCALISSYLFLFIG